MLLREELSAASNEGRLSRSVPRRQTPLPRIFNHNRSGITRAPRSLLRRPRSRLRIPLLTRVKCPHKISCFEACNKMLQTWQSIFAGIDSTR